MYCETHTSHNFMFVLTWLYGVIVSDGGVESHCETIEIAIAGILNKLYAWIQVVYLNRSHSLLLNRLLLYVFHLFYTYFFDDMVAISFRIYDDRPRDRVSYSWRMMLIISTSLTSSLRLGKWRAWHWPLLKVLVLGRVLLHINLLVLIYCILLSLCDVIYIYDNLIWRLYVFFYKEAFESIEL